MSNITRPVTLHSGGGKHDVDDRAQGSSRWWNREIDPDGTTCVHDELIPYADSLVTAWDAMAWYDRCHDRIYENRALRGMSRARRAFDSIGFDFSRLLVTTSIVDSFVSRITRRRPMPMVIVDDANYQMRRQGGELQAFIRGKMREPEVEPVSASVVQDAFVRGTGIAYIDDGDDDIIIERAHRWELLLDPHEAKCGWAAVRQMIRVRPMAREVLCARYPEHRAIIEAAQDSRSRGSDSDDDWTMPPTSSTGMVDVYEAWHLPSVDYDEGDGEDDDGDERIDDGRKAVCIDGATLSFERWTCERFPFAMFVPNDRQEGVWGQGIVEKLAPQQGSINKIASDIDRNVHLDGHLKIFTPEGMDSHATETLTGDAPMRVRYKGSSPPAYVPPNAVSGSHVSYLQQKIAWMHDFVGITQQSAQGRSPLGAGASGVALDTMEDIQSDRHAKTEAKYSAFRCMVAQLMVDAARRVAQRQSNAKGSAAKRKRKLAAHWTEHGTMRRVEWESAAMEREMYRLQIEPTSFIPNTRAGKLAAVKELAGLGIWDPTAVMEMFDEPDLATAMRETLARTKNARRVMALLGDEEQEVPVPEPQWGLELHKEFALRYYCMALTDGANDETARRFLDYADLCQDMIDASKKPTAPPPGAPPAMPGTSPDGMSPPPDMLPPPPGMPPQDAGVPPLPGA